MSKYRGKYTAQELLNADLKGSDPLIEEVLFERDNVILLGKEKSSKSILALQMSCCLTSQEPLFGQYDIPKACHVVYIQCEGKLAETRDRLLKMNKSIDCDKSKLLFLYYPNVELDTEDGYSNIESDIDSWNRPDVVFIDCLYMAMSGEMEKSRDAKKMVANLRIMSEKYQCTIVILHHTHKIRLHNGAVVEEGDDGIFGSFVWKAYPDHIIMLQKIQGHSRYRKLSCTTQRSSKVFDEIGLYLIEPEPLYFDVRTHSKPSDEKVFAFIGAEPTSITSLVLNSKLHFQTVWSSVKRLERSNKILCINPSDRPHLYIKKT